jgi:protocatechuate 3,4-dioxygenase alpha subunit
LTVEATPSQTVGPFFSFGLCARPSSELVDPDAEGAVRIRGRVLDGAGEPVNDALVEIWQADAEGRYGAGFGWGRCGTDTEGRYSFVTANPGPVSGPDGRTQAPHLTVLVFARGLLKPVLTRMYFPDEEEANASDPVLSAVPDAAGRATLVAQPDGGGLRFDVRLQGEGQTTFFTIGH